MKAVAVKIRSEILRRRLQTAVVVLITLLASAMATVSLTLLARSTAPFDDAFARSAGAHLLIQVDAGRVTPEMLEATRRLPVVTAAGLPHPIANLPVEHGADKNVLEFVGRDEPGGAVDRITLAAGRWIRGPGEVVVARGAAGDGRLQVKVGDVIRVLSRADRPAVKVVGEAIDMNAGHYSRAWVRSEDLPALANPALGRPAYELGYRVRDSDTDAGLARAADAIRNVLPPDAETAPMANWLVARRGFIWIVTIISGALLAFTAFAVAASALIVANSITGAVVASRREIGIMKAIGFTPAEVALVFVGQMLVPAGVGSLAGTVLGVAGSQPLLNQAGSSLGLPPENALYLPIELAVVVGALLVVIVAAVLPAFRAASTNAVSAIAVGAAPTAGGRARLGRAMQRLRLPRPLTVGVDDAFARPVRGLLTLSALLIGVATLTFAVGFRAVAEASTSDPSLFGTNYDVRVDRFGAYPDASIMKTLEGQPATAVVVAGRQVPVRISGIKDPLQGFAIRGDATRLGYHATTGRWFSGPGEAILGPVTFQESHAHLGDTLTMMVDGRPVSFRVVGSYTDFNAYDGRGMRFDWSSYAALPGAGEPGQYQVRLSRGSDAGAFAAAVRGTEPHFLDVQAVDKAANDAFVKLFEAIMGVPALLLVLIAMVGVFNAMLLSTRERAFDIAVLKALGMSGRQVMAMVIAPALLLGLLGAVLGVPAGLQLHRVLMESILSIYGGVFDLGAAFTPASIGLIGLAGMVIAGVGALLPALWAARAPVAVILRAE